MTYQIELRNSTGLLDDFRCQEGENEYRIASALAKHLATGAWLLQDGDTIKIRAV